MERGPDVVFEVTVDPEARGPDSQGNKGNCHQEENLAGREISGKEHVHYPAVKDGGRKKEGEEEKRKKRGKPTTLSTLSTLSTLVDRSSKLLLFFFF